MGLGGDGQVKSFSHRRHQESQTKGRSVRGESVQGMRVSSIGRWATWRIARGLLVCILAVIGCGLMWAQDNPTETPGQAPGKELPEAPGETKKESSTPVQQVEGVTKQAVDLTKNAATAGLFKARDWESSHIAGIYVGKNRRLVTLSREQREQVYLRETLTTPEAYIKRMFGAAIDQARGVPDWQGGIGGFGERWASREGQFITANTFAAYGNAKLGYEVRYDRCKCDRFKTRLRHAIVRNFLTYDRTEEELRPQWALYGGAFIGGVVATTWKPSGQSYGKNGLYGMLGQAGYGTLLNVVTEFAVEINRKQGVK